MKIFFVTASLLILVSLTVLLSPKQLNKQNPINPNTLHSSYNPDAKSALFHNTSSSVPSDQYYKNIVAKIPDIEEEPSPYRNVLGSKSKREDTKVIKIDLTNQRLYAYKNDKKVYGFTVSTGKWGKTPTGEFNIWTKLEYTLMKGGSKVLNTYYYLPNVPYTMYFYNADTPKYLGFGIHGTYWHNNFGHPMSHGCVNMKPEDAKVLFYWSKSEQEDGKGTKVIIYGTAPNS